jgi:hypothetical protein
MVRARNVRAARAGLVVLVLVGTGIAEACSPETSRPPLETTVGNNAGASAGGQGGGGSGGATVDGGTSADDGATAEDGSDGAAVLTDAGGVDANGCTTGNCIGCCDTQGICQQGSLDTACGVLGFACKSCEAGTSCASGFCQP